MFNEIIPTFILCSSH